MSKTNCDSQVPSISGDGKRIAFWSKCPSADARIYYSDLVAGSLVPVVTGVGGCSVEPPEMSADGDHIAFISTCDLTGDNAAQREEIYELHVPTHMLAQVTHTVSSCSYLRLSINGDGRFLAFSSNCGLSDTDSYLRDIYRLDAITGLRTQVTNRSDGCDDDRPSISGDGTRIAFESNCDLRGKRLQGKHGVLLADLTAKQRGGSMLPDRAVPHWTNYGPHGYGSASSLVTLAVNATNPHTLDAGTFPEDVFKSIDGGISWVSIKRGLRLSNGSDVRAFATSPATPDVVYVGSYGSGVFKSTDGGASWKAANGGLTEPFVTALAITSTAPVTLYAATIGAGVFESRDEGTSWAAVNEGLSNLEVLALAIDSTIASPTIYAGTAAGIFKTTDAGVSWSAANNGLPLLEVPQLPPREGSSTGMAAPTATPTMTYGEVNVLTVDRRNPRTIYAGVRGTVYVSADGGDSWHPGGANTSKYRVDALVIDPGNPRTVYEATGGAILKSTDGGNSWSAVATDNVGSPVKALAVAPTAPSILYAGTERLGAFQSNDGGNLWTPANRGMAKLFVSALGATATTLFAATNNRGIFGSTDGGCSWNAVNTGLPNPALVSINALAVDPASAETIYAGTASEGVFKTTDSGGTWHAANAGLPNVHMPISALLRPAASRALYAARSDGLFRSINGGASWSSAGLTGQFVVAVASDPASPTTLYAGTYDKGLFESTDNGTSWRSLNIWNVSVLAVAPHSPSTIYAGFSGYTKHGIVRSTDAGGSWEPVNAGLPDLSSLGITALAIDPVKTKTVYASTSSSGVFRSRDGGDLWQSVSAGLETLSVRNLAFNPARPTLLYAVTDDGVFGSRPCGLHR